jgi:hypothetical protein
MLHVTILRGIAFYRVAVSLDTCVGVDTGARASLLSGVVIFHNGIQQNMAWTAIIIE